METTASSKEMTTGEGGGSEQITAADVTERITRTVIRTANYTSLTGGGDAGDTTTSSLAYE
ncbi:unnamed protein product [Anisakis simplex]|uniref:Major capsid protein n=1 Tax=Anisakis simplex TaxID=6269 RepID=A0A0M3J7H4_ANISI|nr:unnamed protein product [Anisakis simplex]VDK21581.1 unnamed protein product [Anisakis simplex]